MKDETKCLHAGYQPENGGPRVVPIVQSTTYVFDSTEHIGALFDMPTAHMYSRFSNPTCEAVEKKIAALEGGGVRLAGRVALLGCGGVGRTFACEAALAGCTVVNAVRESDLPQGEELQRYVRQLVPAAETALTTLDRLEGDFDLLINATPVGMYPHAGAMPVEKPVLSRVAAVFDAVYNPGETALLECTRANGAKTVGGMPMLVWQAAIAHRIWYQAEFAPDAIAALIGDAQREMARRFG